MTHFLLTPSQTVGPFFHDSLLRSDARRNVMAPPEADGERLRIEGRVLDGDGLGVPDALVELWQANAHGRYRHALDRGPAPLDPAFQGFGRSGTDDDGRYWFETIRPGAVASTGGQSQAPHICVAVFGRGLLNHLFTRLYFADEPANGVDEILSRIPVERRGTILAPRVANTPVVTYRFDIVLQGERETVFLDFVPRRQA